MAPATTLGRVQTSLLPQVSAANDLTARWCAAAGSSDFVVSGCGVWPLLGLLATAADGPARGELAAAVGLPAAAAQAAALDLLGMLGDAKSLAGALGIWVRRDIELRDAWVRSLPAGTVEQLTGQTALDSWAAGHTAGLIDRFPVHVTADTALLLATAVVARTAWVDPFHDDVLEPESGSWQGHRGPGLYRYSRQLRDAAILATTAPVTRVVVRGDNDLDVHLLVGDMPPGGVLAAGFGALDGSVEARTDLPVGTTGPGLTVRHTRAMSDALRIHLPPFEIRCSHDLLAQPGLFGLRAATDRSHGHFPAVSPTPLCVDSAAQHTLARFTAAGFEAAAVTAVAVAVAAAFRPTRPAVEIAVTFDRPFGFLAVHRPTGLVIVAGWVASPPV
jgi:serine protease inhibitor